MQHYLLDLPIEILLQILQNLPVSDLCAVSISCKSLHSLVREESIWFHRAKQDFQAELQKEENFSARQFYQQVLHKFGPLCGVWQRTDLRYYSGLIRVLIKENSVVFEELRTTYNMNDELRKEEIFTIRGKNDEEYVDVEKGSLFKLIPGKIKIMFEDKTYLEEENEDGNYFKGFKRVLYNFFVPDTQTIGETEGILRIYNQPAEELEMGKLFEDYIASEVGTNIDIDGINFFQLFQLPIEKCRETFYANSSAWYKKLNAPSLGQVGNPIREGLFKGDYGPHGVELIHLQVPDSGVNGLTGLKVTGDPNVPFDKISFRVTESKCLNISHDAQRDCGSILQFHKEPQYVDYQEGLKLKFRIPDRCHGTENFPENLNWCMGRWSCECQIAGNGYTNPEMILGNFILFNENLFAVLFLDLNSLSLYRRVEDLTV